MGIFPRLADHLKRQDWNAIVVEIAIVAIGVLMGIQASIETQKLKAASRFHESTAALVAMFDRELS